MYADKLLGSGLIPSNVSVLAFSSFPVDPDVAIQITAIQSQFFDSLLNASKNYKSTSSKFNF